jgi:peptidoglycan/LPS O-acetylase OafA/YrhL
MPSLTTYAMRRAARILPGFWFALTATFLLSFAVFDARLDGELVLRFVAGWLTLADWHWLTFFPVEVNSPLWSISFEVTSYLLLPLSFALVFAISARLGRGPWLPLAWLVVIALALVAHGLFTLLYPIDEVRRGWDYGLVGGAKYWMPRYNPFAFFAMFAVGALAAGVQVVWIKGRSAVFDVIALCAVAWSIERMAYGLGVPYDFPWFVLPVGLFLAVAPATVLAGRVLDNPPVRYIARISFGIYVWHYLVLELVRLFWDPELTIWTATDPVRFAVSAGVVTLVSILLAHLSYRLIEAPVIGWARGMEERWSGRATAPSVVSSAAQS